MTLDVSTLEPKHHAPPPGWDATTFEAVTTALAAALVAAVRRGERDDEGVHRKTGRNAGRRSAPDHPEESDGQRRV